VADKPRKKSIKAVTFSGQHHSEVVQSRHHERRHMDLFTSDTFEKGGWATELYNQHLKDTTLSDLKGWTCNWKMWHGTYQRWLQYQPLTGQFFWSSKPAVWSTRDALYAGYYVERGFSPAVAMLHHKPDEEVIRPHWHWWPFLELLTKHPETLFSTLAVLPADRRCIWICDSGPRFDVTAINLGKTVMIRDIADLAEPTDHIGKVRDDHWIDLVVGVRYTKDECLNRNKWASLVQGIINALELTADLVNHCDRPSPSR